MYICPINNNSNMYTINKSYGIGKVESIENGTIVSYYDEADKTCKTLEKFTKVYSTIEEAELALNPTLTEEDKAAFAAESESDRKIMIEGSKASEFMYNQHLKALNTYRKNKMI